MLLFVSGGIGGAARYWLGGLLYERIGSTFPYGALAVNPLSCILIGVLMAAMEERFLVYPIVGCDDSSMPFSTIPASK
jgi:fluoride ion exporter CrcB/FEX